MGWWFRRTPATPPSPLRIGADGTIDGVTYVDLTPRPAGWYTDPHDARYDRYWTGTAWQHQVRVAVMWTLARQPHDTTRRPGPR